mmetsp:Transcript_37185/g.80864  ORF Transcript_37185/g.80864 Transcript_37185/m.80864 type:complete len:143 (-) Transcript_37185:46-474(-)
MNSKKSALGRLLRDAATALGRDGSEGEQFLKPLLDNWFDTPESLVKTSPELLVTLGIPLRMAAELIAMATSSSTGAGAASAATISSSSSSSRPCSCTLSDQNSIFSCLILIKVLPRCDFSLLPNSQTSPVHLRWPILQHRRG